VYSVVLLAALTTSTEAVDFGHRGCHGYSYTYSARHSYYGGWRCHRVYTGCYSCYGCYGCWGSPYYYYGSGFIVSPVDAALPATIMVSLPADAKLTINDSPTTSTSATRTFVSPPLERGSSYIYTLRAEVNGQAQSQDIRVQPGEITSVQFTFATKAVAGR
jgi:uncharacterized protein (TIGR03000 family)